MCRVHISQANKSELTLDTILVQQASERPLWARCCGGTLTPRARPLHRCTVNDVRHWVSNGDYQRGHRGSSRGGLTAR